MFVTWNVVFDRAVAVAGSEFAREQVLRYQQGQPVRSIDDAFRPRIGAAALTATGWAAAVVAAGVVVMSLSRRRGNDSAPDL